MSYMINICTGKNWLFLHKNLYNSEITDCTNLVLVLFNWAQNITYTMTPYLTVYLNYNFSLVFSHPLPLEKEKHTVECWGLLSYHLEWHNKAFSEGKKPLGLKLFWRKMLKLLDYKVNFLINVFLPCLKYLWHSFFRLSFVIKNVSFLCLSIL